MKDHLPEYFAEFLGTAIMMMIGIGAVTLMFAAATPMRDWIPSDDVRRLITGIIFAGGATAVVLSPLGQRSGGHLNPRSRSASGGKVRSTRTMPSPMPQPRSPEPRWACSWWR